MDKIAKAVVAAVMAVVTAIVAITGVNFSIPEGFAEAAIAILTTFLVWFVPNKPPVE